VRRARVMSRANGPVTRHCIFNRNGVSVTRSLDAPGLWAVTHQPTGHRMPEISTTLPRATAVGIAATLAAVGDWSFLRNTSHHYDIEAACTTCAAVAEMFGDR
jgi:hypothetical protein